MQLSSCLFSPSAERSEFLIELEARKAESLSDVAPNAQPRRMRISVRVWLTGYVTRQCVPARAASCLSKLETSNMKPFAILTQYLKFQRENKAKEDYKPESRAHINIYTYIFKPWSVEIRIRLRCARVRRSLCASDSISNSFRKKNTLRGKHLYWRIIQNVQKVPIKFHSILWWRKICIFFSYKIVNTTSGVFLEQSENEKQREKSLTRVTSY